MDCHCCRCRLLLLLLLVFCLAHPRDSPLYSDYLGKQLMTTTQHAVLSPSNETDVNHISVNLVAVIHRYSRSHEWLLLQAVIHLFG